MSPIPLGFLAASGAGVAGSYDLLESVVLSSASSSVTFSSLSAYSATYKHLQIRTAARVTSTAGGLLKIRLNNDSGYNYTSHRLTGNGSSVTSSNTVNEWDMLLVLYGNSNTSTEYGAAIIDIFDFASTQKRTTVKAFGGAVTSNNVGVSLASGLWNNTAAVTSIELEDSGFSFSAGSRFSLYGTKGM